MARKRKRKTRGTKPVLRLGGGVFRVVLGPGLGDPAVWAGVEGQRVRIALAEVAELERMWEASDG